MADQISQRCLKVGEEIRRILSTIIQNQGFYHPGLMGLSLTISEVRMTPDLRNATVYALPLGGSDRTPEILAALKEETSRLRYELGKKIRMKYTPTLRFQLDTSFDQVASLEKALKKKS